MCAIQRGWPGVHVNRVQKIVDKLVALHDDARHELTAMKGLQMIYSKQAQKALIKKIGVKNFAAFMRGMGFDISFVLTVVKGA